jgi:hypothetical protein
MTTTFVNSIVPTSVLLVATGVVVARPARGMETGVDVPICEVINRDKTGTNPVPKYKSGSQVAENKPHASHVSLEAEGRGFEPPTAFAAPDFESGCWPIRLPSGHESSPI